MCRVFHTKLLEFIDDITAKQYFGVPLKSIHTVEFQKRGLPHAQVLSTLRPEDKLDTEAAVCDELPDTDPESRLYDIARNFSRKNFGQQTYGATRMVSVNTSISGPMMDRWQFWVDP
ncbi:unnamed protein product [Phaedon cochleariae]|uniref:Helitron helicase-like domain-containing protein n=1 Tax=Phaedon cochleariae TaxID=80249 RepID=A0A9P0GQE0_PHACE|nr:unnamed protein product [Phaedon cochleariae]